MAAQETREERRRLARTSPETIEFLSTEGWRAVGGKTGGWSGDDSYRVDDRCGLVAHRGILHPAEYVDRARLTAALEERLGCALSEFRALYTGRGRRTRVQMALRARIDAHLLAIRDAGGNMTALARATGVDEQTLHRGTARAKMGVARA